MKVKLRLNWRLVWYSVLIWLLAFVLSGLVVLPWYYLVMPLVVFSITAIYFRKVVWGSISYKDISGRRDRIFALGLGVSLLWFLILVIVNILEFVGLYYSNFHFYFSDFRNWMLYPLMLLTPVVYSLMIANGRTRRSSKKKHFNIGRFLVRSGPRQVAT